MSTNVTVRGEGISVDLLLWRLHGIEGRALVEQTLALNTGLSALGPILPLGTELLIPDLPVKPAAPAVKIVSLFGEV